MPEISRNLKIETSTPRSRRNSDDDDQPYRGPIQAGIVHGRLTIKDAPTEQPVGEPCNAWHPAAPWTQQKKEAVAEEKP